MPTAPNPRIFVVDDEEVLSMTVAAILRRSGFEVMAFTNPMECLAAASTVGPDLLISDVVMPELSGVELAFKMKEACPECVILLVSGIVGTAHPMLEGRAQSHCFDLLAKPVEPVLLIHEVRRRLVHCSAA